MDAFWSKPPRQQATVQSNKFQHQRQSVEKFGFLPRDPDDPADRRLLLLLAGEQNATQALSCAQSVRATFAKRNIQLDAEIARNGTKENASRCRRLKLSAGSSGDGPVAAQKQKEARSSDQFSANEGQQKVPVERSLYPQAELRWLEREGSHVKQAHRRHESRFRHSPGVQTEGQERGNQNDRI